MSLRSFAALYRVLSSKIASAVFSYLRSLVVQQPPHFGGSRSKKGTSKFHHCRRVVFPFSLAKCFSIIWYLLRASVYFRRRNLVECALSSRQFGVNGLSIAALTANNIENIEKSSKKSRFAISVILPLVKIQLVKK